MVHLRLVLTKSVTETMRREISPAMFTAIARHWLMVMFRDVVALLDVEGRKVITSHSAFGATLDHRNFRQIKRLKIPRPKCCFPINIYRQAFGKLEFCRKIGAKEWWLQVLGTLK